MKKNYLLGVLLGMGLAVNAQTTVINDDFESYSLGPLNNTSWDNWDQQGPNNSLDIIVSDKRASSGTKSGYIGVHNDNNGQDALLKMPQVYTTGIVTSEWKMYVPADSVAYFNMQESDVAGDSYGFECMINGYSANDTLMGGVSLANKMVWTFTDAEGRYVFGYTPLQTGQWVTVKQVIDLTNSKLNVFVNGNEITYYYYKSDTDPGNTYPGTQKSVAAFDFYSLADTSNNNSYLSSYYIDDVKVTTENSTGINTVEKNSKLISAYPNPCTDYINFSAKDQTISNVEVFNIFGQKVMSTNVKTASAKLNTQSLAPGIYTAKVTTKDGAFTKKFVVK